jgi:hypothetical protein
MKSHILRDESDVQLMRDLIQRLSDGSTVVDLDEMMLLPSVRATTRLWQQDGQVTAFALVDEL